MTPAGTFNELDVQHEWEENTHHTHTRTHTRTFSCDCMLWDDRRGRLTGQPLGLLVGTATMTAAVMGAKVAWTCGVLVHDVVRSGVHTRGRRPYSATLCIRLALPLTLSLPSRSAPSERLRVGVGVGVPPRTLRLAGVFLRRNKICAGVVETR